MYTCTFYEGQSCGILRFQNVYKLTYALECWLVTDSAIGWLRSPPPATWRVLSGDASTYYLQAKFLQHHRRYSVYAVILCTILRIRYWNLTSSSLKKTTARSLVSTPTKRRTLIVIIILTANFESTIDVNWETTQQYWFNITATTTQYHQRLISLLEGFRFVSFHFILIKHLTVVVYSDILRFTF